MKVFYSPAYVMAATDFESTCKAGWIAASLHERPIAGIEIIEPAPLTAEVIGAVHDPAYVEAVQTGEPAELAASNGVGWRPLLFDAEAAVEGGTVAAALDALTNGRISGSLGSSGHHARRARGNGFCTFNGLALAAKAARDAGAERVLILDLDAHCGGGTYSLIKADPGIVQIDVAVNLFDYYEPPEPHELLLVMDPAVYLATIQHQLGTIDRFGSFDLVLYNAGMDPFGDCPIGGLPGINEAMLAERERMVFSWARSRGLPLAFVMAGGYLGDEVDQRRLVDLHRMTLSAAQG